MRKATKNNIKKAKIAKQYEFLAACTKALAHPARLLILSELAKRQSCICGEIVSILPLAQSTVSQHLKALKEAGFITGTISGTKSCYCLNHEFIKLFKNEIGNFNELIFKNKINNICC